MKIKSDPNAVIEIVQCNVHGFPVWCVESKDPKGGLIFLGEDLKWWDDLCFFGSREEAEEAIKKIKENKNVKKS